MLFVRFLRNELIIKYSKFFSERLFRNTTYSVCFLFLFTLEFVEIVYLLDSGEVLTFSL